VEQGHVQRANIMHRAYAAAYGELPACFERKQLQQQQEEEDESELKEEEEQDSGAALSNDDSRCTSVALGHSP
jgi:hypothetical protein